MIPTSAYDDRKAHALSIALQSAADGLDTAGDPSSSNWMEGFADDAYAVEAERDALREALRPFAERAAHDECSHHACGLTRAARKALRVGEARNTSSDNRATDNAGEPDKETPT